MKMPIKYEKTDTPAMKIQTVNNLSSSAIGWKSPKPTVDNVVNV